MKKLEEFINLIRTHSPIKEADIISSMGISLPYYEKMRGFVLGNYSDISYNKKTRTLRSNYNEMVEHPELFLDKKEQQRLR